MKKYTMSPPVILLAFLIFCDFYFLWLQPASAEPFKTYSANNNPNEPYYALVLNSIGSKFLNAGQYDSAIIYFRKSLDQAQHTRLGTYPIYSNLGLTLFRLEKYEEAELPLVSAYNQVSDSLKRYPQNTGFMYETYNCGIDLCINYCQLKKYQDAQTILSLLEKNISIELLSPVQDQSCRAERDYAAGLIYFTQGDWSRAADSFIKFLNAEEQRVDLSAVNLRGIAYQRYIDATSRILYLLNSKVLRNPQSLQKSKINLYIHQSITIGHKYPLFNLEPFYNVLAWYHLNRHEEKPATEFLQLAGKFAARQDSLKRAASRVLDEINRRSLDELEIAELEHIAKESTLRKLNNQLNVKIWIIGFILFSVLMLLLFIQSKGSSTRYIVGFFLLTMLSLVTFLMIQIYRN